jgi:hypothetical protein
VQVCPVIAGRPGPPLAYLSLLEAVTGAGAALQTLAALRAAGGHQFDFVMKRRMSSSLLGFPERAPDIRLRPGGRAYRHGSIVDQSDRADRGLAAGIRQFLQRPGGQAAEFAVLAAGAVVPERSFRLGAALSDALVAKLRSDIVLCQTIERFLPDVPPA